MTTLVITQVGDTWVNNDSSPNRQGTNYGDTGVVRLQSGARRGLLLPELPNLAGATILDAHLIGYAAPDGLDAQDITVSPLIERWSPGRATWTNQPDNNAAAAVVTAVSATAVDAPVTLTGLDAIIQAVADGTDWFGLRVTTDHADSQAFRSTESGHPSWSLVIEVSDVPSQPDNLRPDGGLAVGTSVPILAWESVDFGETDTAGQASFKIQVDTPTGGADPDDVSPDFDSGWVTGADPQYDLDASTHTPSGAGPHYWRVMVRDADSNASDWSDWAEYIVDARPTLTVDSPTGAFGDPTPLILATLSGEALTHWDGIITGSDRSDIRYRSGPQDGAISWQIPLRNEEGRRILEDRDTGQAGWLRLRAWGNVDRAVAVGQPPYVETWTELEFDDDLGIVAPTNLSVAQHALGDARNRWSFLCAEAPEAFTFAVDGVLVARVDIEDMVLDGGTYTWLDNGQVPPLLPHTLTVRAVDGGDRSEPLTVTDRTHTVEGVWFLPDDADPLCVAGTGVAGFSHTSRRARYETLVGPPVDVVYDPAPGRLGEFAGQVDSSQDVAAILAQIDALRNSPHTEGQLVWGTQSIRARLVDPDATPSDEILPNNLQHEVRFSFVQLDD